MVLVSVAGCLGYDVLGDGNIRTRAANAVSVAGWLGYDVLDSYGKRVNCNLLFQLLVV